MHHHGDSVVLSTRIRAVDRARMSPASSPTELPELSVVVPLFDEQDTLPELHRRLIDTLRGLAHASEIVYVNDGSHDDTTRLLNDFAANDSRVTVVHFSRNFGHQAAVSAGMNHARGRAVIVMDGDLQDPPELIPQLLERWRTGYEVVYAVRAKRREGPLKRLGYWVFYRLLRATSDLEIPLDAGDFCLMDRRAVDALNRLPERGRFVRGLRAFVGFRQIGVNYDRDSRHAGQPKYTLRKLAALAADGLFGFSGFPIRVVAYIGCVLMTLAGIGGTALLVDVCCGSGALRGWAVVGILLLLVGGLQLIGLGVIGEYVRRIFLETTGRPAYIVREVVRSEDKDTVVRRE